ncbi:hypothetical protein [Marinifilum flexuosum]|uniref:SpoIIAA-like protein n=1 Tax=Marinifilum flexuosum TaxID=1117708 RepID=A0A419WGX0_9BACT|nr:hypothetical protein [Marinifilum flexuosum]RKD94596.1 hypothetical protein BXY64_4184 [Marinifilum flexuosum]
MADVVYDKVEVKNSCVIIRSFYGFVEIHEVLDSFLHMRDSLICKNVIGIVTDFESANLNFKLSDLEIVVKHINNEGIYKNIKLAIVVDTPKKTVFPIIAQAKLKEAKLKPFASLKAAMNWVCN